MMKFVSTASMHRNSLFEERTEGSYTFDLRVLAAILRRRWLWLILPVLLFTGLAIVHVLTRDPTYTAVATLVVDTRRPSVIDSDAAVSDPVTNISLIESELETLRSRRVAEIVVDSLALHLDEEFNGGGSSLLSRFQRDARASLGLPPAEAAPISIDDQRGEVVDTLMKNVSARRIGSSFVMEVSAKASDPGKAALIANEVIEAYLADQRGFRAEVVDREVAWLEERLHTLRERLQGAELEARNFKVENNIVDLDDRLLVDQQLAEISSQHAAARDDLARSEARLDRIQYIIASGQLDENVSEELSNSIITDLRRQQNDMSRRAEEWAARYGADHPTAVRLQTELAGLQRSIREEVGRIAESSRSDFEIARVRVDSLGQSLTAHMERASQVRNAQVQLRALEGAASSYREAYEGVLNTLLDALNVERSPVSNARVVTVASPPTKQSGPGGSTLVLAAAFAGGIAGFGLALGRDGMDRRVKSARQLEDACGVRCVGTLPLVAERRRLGRWLKAKLLFRRAPPDEKEGAFNLPTTGAATYAIRNPYSPFAETMRALKVAIDFRSGSDVKVIGLTSASSGEGKTSVAANFAGLLAQSGARVLLIDADLRNPNLTRTLAPTSERGLDSVLDASSSLSDVVRNDVGTGLHLVPGTRSGWSPKLSEQLCGENFARLLADAEEEYNYVILDLPPFGLIVDAHALCRYLTDVVLVATWGETPTDALEKALHGAPMVHERLAACILNKAKLSKLRAYDPGAGAYYSSPYWSVRAS